MTKERICIIGSGASGVHFALSLVRKGYDVVMLDVGFTKSVPVNREDRFVDLKKKLDDPVGYFLGQGFESVILPDFDSEYYGLPPSKEYALRNPSLLECRSKGFSPLVSFALGGLAEVWTGGVYPFNEEDLAEFPFGYNEIGPHYDEVSRRIGISGEEDEMARFLPYHHNIIAPLRLDVHSRLLLDTYRARKSDINSRLKCYMGRSRIATLSVPKDGRRECTYSGRCLWGCPTEALYTPSLTVAELAGHPNFRYVPGVFVTHLRCNGTRKVVAAVGRSLVGGSVQEYTADRFVLAAGALMTSKIFLNTVRVHTGEAVKLAGLMDNRQILVPFVNTRMLGRGYDPDSYQYHQIVMGFEGEAPGEYIHGQITTLKTGLFHPIVQGLPFDLKTSLDVFNRIHGALGVVNVNLSDQRRPGCFVNLNVDRGTEMTRLEIVYEPPPGEKDVTAKAVSRVRKALRALGCIAPLAMIHVRPMGASVHYSGTIPMSSGRGDFTTDPWCKSNDFQGLYIADGAAFPALPAKNLTFTLMANAVRIADTAF